MAVHERHVCQVTYCQIRSIAKMRKCLTTAACKTIVHALVMSRVDYGNALPFGLPEMLLHKLQMIQNSAARVVTGTHVRDHITPALFKLHWLPVRYRIEFKLLVSGSGCSPPRPSLYSIVLRWTDIYVKLTFKCNFNYCSVII